MLHKLFKAQYNFFDIMFTFEPPLDKRGYKIIIFIDDPHSWMIPWGEMLEKTLSPFHDVSLCLKKEEIPCGDFSFLLGCTEILPQKYLRKSKLNLVVHESDLPSGRGWSPLSWQVLEEKHEIPIVLFEAKEELDAGPIYLREIIKLNGTELLPELKYKQGVKTIELVYKFLEQWPGLRPVNQVGTPTFYPRRTPAHDKIDIHQTIAENFDHLRIADNEKYPAGFEYRGRKYILKIYAADEETDKDIPL